jgi:alcohol dehydrogenase (cytochrome c)
LSGAQCPGVDEKASVRDACSSPHGGATNWYSPSYDPQSHIFCFRSYEACALLKSETEPFEEGSTYYSTGSRVMKRSGKSSINAFDLDTLDFAWRDLQIGRYKGWGGVMTTAAGLLAYGDDAQNFVILDARSGKPLWHFNVGQLIHASPMSYAVNGKQYFAVAAGSDIFSYALP